MDSVIHSDRYTQGYPHFVQQLVINWINYPVDSSFIHWIGLSAGLSYPLFEQPGPAIERTQTTFLVPDTGYAVLQVACKIALHLLLWCPQGDQ